MPTACTRCRTLLVEGANYCHHCGLRANSASTRGASLVRTIIIAATVVSMVGWGLLFAEVRSVLVTGPIVLVLGLILLIRSIRLHFPSGLALGILHCAVPILLTLLVAAMSWSPEESKWPFVGIGGLYLAATLPLANAAYWLVPTRRDPNRCVRCGYLLCGLTEPRCPECGTPFNPADVDQLPQENRPTIPPSA